ncbi:hypothetical protein HDU93_001075 [Gonapodya sp. JEL0774]|nr:hypothetical protein HDU93_001075 [Gonapodya sp. JEL0774]
MFISAFAGPALPILFVYRANTLKGSTAQATSTGLTIALGNIGGFIAPFTYPNSWAPLYINAIWISFALTLAAMVCVQLIWIYERRMIRDDASWAKEMSSSAELNARDIAAEAKV